MAEEKEKVERAARQAEDERLRQERDNKADRNLALNLHWPEYVNDPDLCIDREVNIPPDSLYLGLGWDENASTKRKHYRKFYNKELEKVTLLMPKPTPFNSYDIKRG